MTTIDSTLLDAIMKVWNGDGIADDHSRSERNHIRRWWPALAQALDRASDDRKIVQRNPHDPMEGLTTEQKTRYDELVGPDSRMSHEAALRIVTRKRTDE